MIVNVIEILILSEEMGHWRASLAMAVNGLKLLYRLDRSAEFKPRNFPENDRRGTKSEIVSASAPPFLALRMAFA